ncbi:MAG: phosphatidate cytidylyltransferase [Nitrospirota bacterium]
MHLKRLIVAAILLPLIYSYVTYLPEGYFLVLMSAVAVLAMWEFYSMYRIHGLLRYSCILLGTTLIAVSFTLPEIATKVLALSIMVVMALRLFVKRTPASSLHDLAGPIVGLLYIPLFLSFQGHLRKIGPEWIIFLYSTVWASDSLAYYIGKGLGKRKLYPEISPNKTVAGAVGSLLGGAAGALLLRIVLLPNFDAGHAAIIGIMIGMTAVVGDLVESMFKRDAGVKDSGALIPGHGGILDKIDGALFAGPLLYSILKIIGADR